MKERTWRAIILNLKSYIFDHVKFDPFFIKLSIMK